MDKGPVDFRMLSDALFTLGMIWAPVSFILYGVNSAGGSGTPYGGIFLLGLIILVIGFVGRKTIKKPEK